MREHSATCQRILHLIASSSYTMPLRTKIECPECGADLVVKRGGVCPGCGARISKHVAHVRAREKRIEQVVAIVGTILVVGVAVVTSGATLLEGIAAYAIVGGVMYYLARRTFV
jgi:hypothetical protein